MQRPTPGLTQPDKSAQRAFDVPAALEQRLVEAVAAPGSAEAQALSAHAWLVGWAADTGKTIAVAAPEGGDVGYSVIHVAADGVVLDKGRSGAVYPVPAGVAPQVGHKMAVNRHGELCPPPDRAVEKNEPGR